MGDTTADGMNGGLWFVGTMLYATVWEIVDMHFLRMKAVKQIWSKSTTRRFQNQKASASIGTVSRVNYGKYLKSLNNKTLLHI